MQQIQKNITSKQKEHHIFIADLNTMYDYSKGKTITLCQCYPSE